MKNKVKTEGFLRIENTVERDRLHVGNEFNDALLYDVKRLLTEYFDLLGNPEISVVKENGEFCVNLSVKAIRLKKFRQIKP